MLSNPIVGANNPDPASVTPASGLVTYRFPYSSLHSLIWLVQMRDNTTTTAEAFDDYHVPNPSGFTSNAKTYIR